jgi:hypothetical protein
MIGKRVIVCGGRDYTDVAAGLEIIHIKARVPA